MGPTVTPTIEPTPTPKPTLPPETKEKIRTFVQNNPPTKSKPNFSKYTEEELEDLMDLFDYETPLYGGLLQTGDETPIYPFVFAGIGIILLVIVITKKKNI
jgi:hypothetical protein